MRLHVVRRTCGVFMVYVRMVYGAYDARYVPVWVVRTHITTGWSHRVSHTLEVCEALFLVFSNHFTHT